MAIHAPQIYDEILEYLASKATPEELLAFKASPKTEEGAAMLIDRNNAGVLTLEQKIELQQIQFLDGRISVLKARAVAHLKEINV